MYYSKLAAPILLVADCTQAPPLDLAEEVLGSEIPAYARQHPSQAHARTRFLPFMGPHRLSLSARQPDGAGSHR